MRKTNLYRIFITVSLSIACLVGFSQSKTAVCDYFSKVGKLRFLEMNDSIANSMIGNYDTVIIFGINNYDESELLIFANSSGHLYSFRYDIRKDRKVSIKGSQKTANLLKAFYLNHNSLNAIAEIPFTYISHDFGLSVTMRTKTILRNSLICYSQVLSIKTEPLGKMFIDFMSIISGSGKQGQH